MTQIRQPGLVPNGLTPAQVRLLKRHRRGLVRLACVFSDRAGVAPDDLLFVLADGRSNIAEALRRAIDTTVGGDALAFPGLRQELPMWLERFERLALHGPIWDCSGSDNGAVVILIDEHAQIVLYRLSGE